MSNPVYIDQEANRRATKSDWRITAQTIHDMLDQANVPHGDEKGAYTLAHRIELVLTELSAREYLDHEADLGAQLVNEELKQLRADLTQREHDHAQAEDVITQLRRELAATKEEALKQ